MTRDDRRGRGRLLARRRGVRARRVLAGQVELATRGDRRQPRRPLAARQAGQRRRRRRVHRGLLQLAAASRRWSGSSAQSGARAIAAELMGADDRAAVPRPRARQGARHPPAHAVAPGPAVLQRRRPPERSACGSPSTRSPRVDARVRRRLAPSGPWYMPRSFLDDQAKWFPDGTLAELPDDRRRPRALPRPRLGARAGRRRVLPHAHAARRRRRRRPEPPAGAVGALPRRRHGARAAAVDDVAAVPGPRRRAPRRRADGPPAVPGPVAATRTRRCHDRPRRSHGRPPGAARAAREVDRPTSSRAPEIAAADRRPHRHDARTPTAPASPPTRSASRVRIATIEVTTTRATRTSRRSR